MFEMFLRNKFYLARQDRLPLASFQVLRGEKVKNDSFSLSVFLIKSIKHNL